MEVFSFDLCLKTLLIATSLLTGWSFGGVVAFESARKLLSMGYPVKGVVLIDSPCPLDHVPLSDSIIDFALNLNAWHPNSEIGELVRMQIQKSSQMLAQHNHCPSDGPYPKLALLHSREAFDPPGIESVPGWLKDRDLVSAANRWKELVGTAIKVWEIPGNHFQTFHACNVCTSRPCPSYLD